MKLSINKKMAPVIIATALTGVIAGYFAQHVNRTATVIMGVGMTGAGAILMTTNKK